MRAFVLVRALPGKTNGAAEAIRRLAIAGTEVVSAETVIGPFDVIAVLEVQDVETLARAVSEGIQCSYGVTRTVTCLSLRARAAQAARAAA